MARLKHVANLFTLHTLCGLDLVKLGPLDPQGAACEECQRLKPNPMPVVTDWLPLVKALVTAKRERERLAA